MTTALTRFYGEDDLLARVRDLLSSRNAGDAPGAEEIADRLGVAVYEVEAALITLRDGSGWLLP